MSDFADHFSPQAAAYRRHRPGYPPALFDFLAAQAPARLRADLARAWGAAAVRAVRWPISMRAGRRPPGRAP